MMNTAFKIFCSFLASGFWLLALGKSMSPASPNAVPAVWVYTTDSAFNGLRGTGYAGFLTGGQQGFLADLVQRTRLHTLLHGAAVDSSYEAEAFFECCIDEGEVYVEAVPADEIFPIGRMRADYQYRRYERYRLKNIGTGGDDAS